MKWQEALNAFSNMLSVGTAATENVMDDASKQSPDVRRRLAEVKVIARRLRDIGHELDRIGGAGQSKLKLS